MNKSSEFNLLKNVINKRTNKQTQKSIDIMPGYDMVTGQLPEESNF